MAKNDVCFYTSFIMVMRSGHNLRTFRLVIKQLLEHRSRYVDSAIYANLVRLAQVLDTFIATVSRSGAKRRRIIKTVFSGGTLHV